MKINIPGLQTDAHDSSAVLAPPIASVPTLQVKPDRPVKITAELKPPLSQVSQPSPVNLSRREPEENPQLSYWDGHWQGYSYARRESDATTQLSYWDGYWQGYSCAKREYEWWRDCYIEARSQQLADNHCAKAWRDCYIEVRSQQLADNHSPDAFSIEWWKNTLGI